MEKETITFFCTLFLIVYIWISKMFYDVYIRKSKQVNIIGKCVRVVVNITFHI